MIAFAQADAPKSAISGTVKDLRTGMPIAGVPVAVASDTGKTLASTLSDAAGRYSFRGLEPGRIQLTAGGWPINFPARQVGSKTFVLRPDQELRGVDLLAQGIGRISGKVTDADGNPMAGVSVLLAAKEYSLGTFRYVASYGGKTGEQGEYPASLIVSPKDMESLLLAKALEELNAFTSRPRPTSTAFPLDSGREYLLLAYKGSPIMLAPEAALPNPADRKPIPYPTWFIESNKPDGAVPITVATGEQREHADLRMQMGPPYCLEGAVHLESSTETRVLSVQIANVPQDLAVSSALMADRLPPGAERDIPVRTCNLPPGDYRVTSTVLAPASKQAISSGTAMVTIRDRDITRLRLTTNLPFTMTGVVAWEKEAPAGTQEVSIQLQPVTRNGFQGRAWSTIPGTFSFDRVMPDDYFVGILAMPPGAYVKDILYGGRSVLHSNLKASSGTELRIVLARDGGTVMAQAVDGNGKAVAGAYVAVIPEGVAGEVELAAAMVTGQTDASGAWSPGLLAPGKYRLIASSAPFEIRTLFGTRNNAQQVEVSPNATVQVRLTP